MKVMKKATEEQLIENVKEMVKESHMEAKVMKKS